MSGYESSQHFVREMEEKESLVDTGLLLYSTICFEDSLTAATTKTWTGVPKCLQPKVLNLGFPSVRSNMNLFHLPKPSSSCQQVYFEGGNAVPKDSEGKNRRGWIVSHSLCVALQ